MTAEVTLLFENSGERLHGWEIRRGLWPLHSPDLTACDFYFWGCVEDKLYRTNLHTMEALRNNIRYEITIICNQEHQILHVFCSYNECFHSGGQHFQHPVIALVSFYKTLKVIVTVSFFLGSLTNR